MMLEEISPGDGIGRWVGAHLQGFNELASFVGAPDGQPIQVRVLVATDRGLFDFQYTDPPTDRAPSTTPPWSITSRLHRWEDLPAPVLTSTAYRGSNGGPVITWRIALEGFLAEELDRGAMPTRGARILEDFMHVLLERAGRPPVAL